MKIHSTRRAARAAPPIRNRFASAARGPLMLGTALGCSIAIVAGAPGTAFAQDCGPVVAGEVTCTSTSGVGNPYPTGIYYAGAAGEDLTVTVGDPMADVVINSGGNYGVFVDASTGQTATIVIEDTVTITTTSSGARANGGVADTVVTSDGDITAGIRGIWAFTTGDTTAENSGDIVIDGASNSFFIAIGVQASSSGANVAYASNTGTIEVTGAANDVVRGMNSSSQSGSAYAYNAGVIDISAVGAAGMVGIAVFAGVHAEVTTTADSTIVLNTPGTGYAYGMFVRPYTGDAVVDAAGDITVTTLGAATGIGVRAQTSADITAGNITVTGSAGTGIWANAGAAVTIAANGDIIATGNDIEGIAAYGNTGIEITATGDISTAGTNAEGIRARGYATADISVTAANVTTTGLNSEGVYAVGNVNIDVTTTGLVSTTGDNSYGVLARSFGAGEVYVSVYDVTTTGDNSEGVWAFGNNAVTVIATGDISTDGSGSRGLYAGSYGAGAVVIDAASVTTLASSSAGIQGDSNLGTVEISFDSVTTSANNSTGVIANAGSGVIITGTGAVISGGVGVYAQTTNGDAEVTLGDVTADGRGVQVVADNGSATVDTGAIYVDGYTSLFGIQAVGATGASITVAGDVGVYSGEGDATGLYVQSDYGLASIVVVGDTVVTATDTAIGVEANGFDEGAYIDVTGSITATSTGARAYGVVAEATYGLIDIDITGDVSADAFSQAYGIFATYNAPPPPPPYYFAIVTGEPTEAAGDPQITDITVDGDIYAYSLTSRATGVSASAADGLILEVGDVYAHAAAYYALGVRAGSYSGDVTVSTGDVIALSGVNSSTGVAVAAGAGNAEVSTGDVQAHNTGVAVFTSGTADVSTGSLTVVGSSVADGLNAASQQDLSATVTGDVTVEASIRATAVVLNSNADAQFTMTGDIEVDAGAGTSFGQGIAVQARVRGDVMIDVTGQIDVYAAYFAQGFYVTSLTGDAQVKLTGDIVLEQINASTRVTNAFEIQAYTGDASVDVVGDVTVTALRATAIDVEAYAGIASVEMEGTLTVDGESATTGMDIHGGAGVVVDHSGLIDVYSSQGVATGVAAVSADGYVSISTGAILVDGYSSAFGIQAVGADDVSATVTGSVDVSATGGSATGVYAQTDGGLASVVIVGDTVVNASGVATGVYAYSYDGGVAVDVTGSISATSTGASAYGVVGYAYYGDVAIEVSGAITADAETDAFGVLVSFGEPDVNYYYNYRGNQQTVISGDVTAALGDPQTVEVTVGGPIVVHADNGVAAGVRVTADDAITVETADITATADTGSAFGLDLDSNYGDVSVVVDGDLTISAPGGSSFAFGMDVIAGGAIDITMTGDIDAQAGWAAYGVLAQGYDNVSVDIDGAITVDAQGNATGARADSQYGSAYAYVVDVDVFAYGTAVAVSVDGQYGATAVSTGQVISSGAGVSARSNLGAASATVVDVTAGSDAVWAITNNGDATVIATGEIISGGAGLSAWAGSGDANVTNDGSVTTSGNYAYGIRATSSSGDVNVDSDGTVETNGDAAYGILARTSTGDIAISFADVSTFGSALVTGSYSGEYGQTYFEYGSASHGIVASSQYGSVLIEGGDVFTDGAGAEGIIATGFGSVFIDVGTVQTEGGPLLLSSGEYGSFYDDDTGAIGIDATVRGGDLTIIADAVYTAGDYATGIFAQASAIYTGEGYEARPAYNTTYSGDILIDAGIVQTLGYDAFGIYASNVGGGSAVSVEGLYTFGDHAFGLYASATDWFDPLTETLLIGDVTIDAEKVRTYGDSSTGVYVRNSGGDIDVNVDNVLTTGDYSAGIAVVASFAVNYGADAVYAGDATVIAGDVATRGDSSVGVSVAAQGGDASAIVGDVYTGGDNSTGISVGAGLNAYVGSSNVVTLGAYSDGIVAQVYSDGLATIVAENVMVYGYGSDAILAAAGGETGSTDISISGIVSSATGTGIRSTAAGYSTITIDNGLVTGAYAAIVSEAGVASIIENDGGFIYGGSGLAIQANGGFAQISNDGFIGGRVDLTEGADLFYNTGVFEAYGTSAFGAGADRFENDGLVRFRGLSGPATTTTFTGLETFLNTSVVTGVDGQAGDVLSMVGTTFNGGVGSELALDVQFGGPGSIADRIVIGQATGVTNIVPNSVLAATPGVLNFAGILVVDSAFASETGAEFTMTTVDTGFVDYSLRFDALTDNWLIVGLPDASAFRVLALPGAMQDFWQRSSVAVTSRWQESRDADGTPGLSAGPDGATGRSEGWEMWMQAHGGDEGFEDIETFSIGGSVFVENQSHDSNWRGFQFGADNRTGDFTWGLTGGFVQQETTFEVGGESFDIEGWNVGAYASWMSGGLFLNGLAKGDFNTVDANLTAVGDMETFDASSFGLQGELGYRLAGDAWFVEPVASLAWTSTRIDSFTASGATLDFEDADSLVGKAGMRLGLTMGSGDVVLVPAIGVFAIDEFEGENAMTFTTGATSFAITDTPPGAYGKVEFGVTAQTFYGLEGYVRGEVNFGDEAEGGAVRLGARWRW